MAVEVDGPSHYAAASATASAAQHRALLCVRGVCAPPVSRPHAPPPRVGAPSSATLLKRRQLRNFGCRLLSVPYYEWPHEREEQRQYLAARFNENSGLSCPVI